jgi:hypothetical protein
MLSQTAAVWDQVDTQGYPWRMAREYSILERTRAEMQLQNLIPDGDYMMKGNTNRSLTY